jgi:hypothetical protein
LHFLGMYTRILFDFYLGLNVDIDIRKSFSVLIHR